MNMLKVILIWLTVFWLTLFACIYGMITGAWGVALFSGLFFLFSFGVMLGVFRDKGRQ